MYLASPKTWPRTCQVDSAVNQYCDHRSRPRALWQKEALDTANLFPGTYCKRSGLSSHWRSDWGPDTAERRWRPHHRRWAVPGTRPPARPHRRRTCTLCRIQLMMPNSLRRGSYLGDKKVAQGSYNLLLLSPYNDPIIGTCKTTQTPSTFVVFYTHKLKQRCWRDQSLDFEDLYPHTV